MSKKCAICFHFTASVLVAWFPLPMKDSSLQWNDLDPRLTPLAGSRWCYSPLQNLWGCQKRVLRSVSSYGLPFLSRTISLQLMSISSILFYVDHNDIVIVYYLFLSSVCESPPHTERSLSFVCSILAFSRKTLQESCMIFVEHALHVARIQLWTQA